MSAAGDEQKGDGDSIADMAFINNRRWLYVNAIADYRVADNAVHINGTIAADGRCAPYAGVGMDDGILTDTDRKINIG